MDPKYESALRRACDQWALDADALLDVVKEHMLDKRLHPKTGEPTRSEVAAAEAAREARKAKAKR